nr:uncharacterized protein LOC117987334 [Maniola hyperantus]
MQSNNEYSQAASYFWDCLTFSKDCPFSNSKLLYFGIALTGLYSVFMLMIIADLKFYWSLDQFQQQIDCCVNFLKKKLKYVQLNQQKLMSTQERTEKQLKRSEECKRIVNMLRGNLSANASKIGFQANVIESTQIEGSPDWSDVWRDSRLTGDFST